MFAILGPTAAGKTGLAIEVATRLGAEVISVDSMQVYRHMNVGTAKPTVVEQRGVVHHMIDLVEPEEEYSVAEFRRMGRHLIESRDCPLVIAGGSGLHFRALVDPMSFAPTDERTRAELEEMSLHILQEEMASVDPNAGKHIDMANKRRLVRAVEIARLTGETPSSRAESARADQVRRYVPEIEFTAVGVDPGRSLTERIRQRLNAMRAGGLVDEVRSLRPRLGRTARAAVGYREILDSLEGKLTLDAAFEAIDRNTHKLAKKQRTWFQRDPRMRWIPWFEDEIERADRAIEVLS